MPSGGKREGAGRKKLSVSDQEIDRLIKACKRKTKEYGETLGDVLMWIAFEYKEKEPRVSLKAIQIYYNTVAVRKSHQTIDKTETYMQFYLPQTQEKPKEAEEFEKQWRGTMH